MHFILLLFFRNLRLDYIGIFPRSILAPDLTFDTTVLEQLREQHYVINIGRKTDRHVQP